MIARRRDRLAEVLADCRTTSPDSRMWVADLGDTAAIGELGCQAWDALGGIDVLINNAAVPKRRAVTALDPFDVEAVMRVNFFAPMQLTLAVLPLMLGPRFRHHRQRVQHRWPAGIIHESAYCASKFALCGWSEALAVDLHGTGVSVKLIQPGPVDTEIWDQPDNDKPLYDGPKVRRTRWPRASSPRSATTASSTMCPTSRPSSTSRTPTSTPIIAGAAAMARP